MSKKPTEYDIIKAYQEMEEYLIASMCRNLYKHIDKKNDYVMWQTEQLKALAKYRKDNAELFGNKYRKTINKDIDEVLRMAYERGYKGEETKILKDIRDNRPVNTSTTIKQVGKNVGKRVPENVGVSFATVNDKKLRSLIKSTTDDMDDVLTATLRNADDQYRKIIYNTQVALNSGILSLDEAVKRATKEFLDKGINCVQYKNGALVNIASYSEMALRTANKRAKLQGEGADRQEMGFTTVLVAPNGNCCPKCSKYTGKVFIDDVWSGGKKGDANYPLLSSAIAGGLYHPNCRDTHTTYIEGITRIPEPLTPQEKADQEKKYKLEQKQRYLERQLRKAKRLRDNAMTEDDKAFYDKIVKGYSRKINDLCKQYPKWLRRKPNRESTYGISKLVPPVPPVPKVTPKKTPVKNVPKTPVPKVTPTTVVKQRPSVNMEVMNAYRGGKKYGEEMAKLMANDDVPIVALDVWNKYGKDIKIYKPSNRNAGAHYSPFFGGVHMKIKNVAQGNYFQAPYSTAFHEFGHNIDNLAYKDHKKMPRNMTGAGHICEEYKSGAYNKLIKEEARDVVLNHVIDEFDYIENHLNNLGMTEPLKRIKQLLDKHAPNRTKDEVAELFYNNRDGRVFKSIITRSLKTKLEKELTPLQRADISDMFEGSGQIGMDYFLGLGHGLNYWKTHEVCVEAFAEMYSATISSPESLKQIKRFFPKSYDMFLEILHHIAYDL